MEAARVVEVYCEAGGTVGTGYLTTGDTVLTAWHVVQAAGPAGVVEVRPLARDGRVSQWCDAVVVWPTAEDLPCPVDAALLVLAADSPRRPSGLAPVRWGRITGDRTVAVTGLGFPDAASDRTPGGAIRDSLALRGRIDPLAHAKSADRHVLVGLNGPLVPARRDGRSSPWAGASGAVLFSDGSDIVLAVTTEDHDLATDARTLIAVPATALAAAPGFAAVARDHGLELALVDVVGDGAAATAIMERPPTPLPPVAQVPAPAGLSNIPRREVFVGRTRELDRLSEVMAAGTGVVTQAIAGLGGIGKSTLAAEYARQHLGAYTGAWWLTADSRANAEAGLADLARRLAPDAAADHDDRVLSDWALSWLQGNPGVLLVWDNVDDVEDISPLLAELSGCAHHLITSRREGGWHRLGVAQPLRLGTMAADEAVDLLTTLAGPELVGQVAAELGGELGHLPLAVEQVGAYLAEAGVGAQEYLELWRTAQAKAVAWAPESRTADRIMTGVWRITLDKLADTPKAGDLLRVMAWFASDGIPRRLLDLAAGSAEARQEALRRLNAYSMVSLNRSDGSVAVHRVVQAVTRAADPSDPHRAPEAIEAARGTAIDVLRRLTPADDIEAESESEGRSEAVVKWRMLLPHIDAFSGHVDRSDVTADAVDVMDRAFDFLRSQGNAAVGIRIAACSLVGKEELHGLDDPSTLESRSNLAVAYEAAGDAKTAVPLFERNLAERVRILGEDHPDTLTSRNDLGGAYRSAGDLERAVPILEQTLEDRVRVLGEIHPDTLTTRSDLAYSYGWTGDFERAIPLFELTLTARAVVLGAHPRVLASRHNLAAAYERAGEREKSSALFQLNYAKRIRSLGQDGRLKVPAALADAEVPWARAAARWGTSGVSLPPFGHDDFDLFVPSRRSEPVSAEWRPPSARPRLTRVQRLRRFRARVLVFLFWLGAAVLAGGAASGVTCAVAANWCRR